MARGAKSKKGGSSAPSRNDLSSYDFSGIIGDSAGLTDVLRQISLVAPEDVTVLLLGESGVGKELIAKAIHDNSPRKKKPFVAVNCMALSAGIIESELFGHEKGSFTGAVGKREGRFEAADGGTLFLDEIGELSLSIQVKLLRVLQERSFERVGGTKTVRVDVRLITATNVDLQQAVMEKRFRDDFYYRLNTFTVNIPPLRERADDIPHLANFFIKEMNERTGKSIKGLSKGSLIVFKEYAWPGNIRELRNAVEYAFVLEKEDEIQPENLPPTLTGKEAPLPIAIERKEEFLDYPKEIAKARRLFEKRFCQAALRRCAGDTVRASREVGVSLRDFTRFIEQKI